MSKFHLMFLIEKSSTYLEKNINLKMKYEI